VSAERARPLLGVRDAREAAAEAGRNFLGFILAGAHG
jgi:hypothetical protein